MRFFRIFLSSLCFVLVAVASAAEIKVKVVDPQSAVVAGAQVALFAAGQRDSCRGRVLRRRRSGRISRRWRRTLPGASAWRRALPWNPRSPLLAKMVTVRSALAAAAGNRGRDRDA